MGMTTVVDDAPIAGGVEVDPMAPDENARFGYMIDPVSGERRPKRSPGKRARPAPPAGEEGTAGPELPPSIEELKSRSGRRKAAEDVAPGPDQRNRRQRRREEAQTEEVPPFRAGPIAKGMNRQYRKAGRVFRLFDPAIGQALIDCATPDPDADEGEGGGTVGEAWEELARTSPRWRMWLLRRLQHGAMAQLWWSHLPLFVAVIPRLPGFRRIPWDRLFAAMMTDDDQEPGDVPGPGDMFGGLTPDDMAMAMSMASRLFPGGGFPMGFPMPAPPMPDAPPAPFVDRRNPDARRLVEVDQIRAA